MYKKANTIPQSPKDKVPADAMPKSNQKHGGDLCEENDHPRLDLVEIAAQITSYRIEIVCPKPLGKGDMPMIPEKCHIPGQIRLAEIFGELNACQLSQSDGNIGISCEVKKDTECVTIDNDPSPNWMLDLAN